jgi:hypothetical protein
MARERIAQDLRAVLPGGMRWLLAGYVLPAIVIGATLLLIRSGLATAHSYNYALVLFAVLLLSATIAAVCLSVAVVVAVQSLRQQRVANRWPHYAILVAAVVPAAVVALWLVQS